MFRAGDPRAGDRTQAAAAKVSKSNDVAVERSRFASQRVQTGDTGWRADDSPKTALSIKLANSKRSIEVL